MLLLTFNSVFRIFNSPLKPVLIKKISGVRMSIAAVSLIVGGVGIMGVMLGSVTEGTREIGLRTAEGADSKDTLCQFPFEAVGLPLVRGSVGILVGHGAHPWSSSLYTLPIHELKKGIKLGDTFGLCGP